MSFHPDNHLRKDHPMSSVQDTSRHFGLGADSEQLDVGDRFDEFVLAQRTVIGRDVETGRLQHLDGVRVNLL